MKRALGIALLVIAACGGGKPAATTTPASGSAGSATSGSDDDLTITPTGVTNDTPIHKRRNAACDQVGGKVAACAAEDTKNDKAHPPTADELAQLPQTEAIDKREYVKKCDAIEMSSRQVRVMEVCLQQETACEPFLSCLDNLNKPAP